MKRINLILAALLFLIISLPAQSIGKKVIGDNHYIQKIKKVGDFKKLVVNHVKANVIYSNNPDSAGMVRIYGEENVVNLLDITSDEKQEKLSIKYINMANVENGLLMIYVFSPAIELVDITGGVIVESTDKIESQQLKLAVSGSGQIKMTNLDCNKLTVSLLTGSGDVLVKGKAVEAKYSVIGGGEIRADELLAANAGCSLKGNGNIGCNVDKLLKVSIWGNGNIYYKGNAEVKSSIIGKGNVKKLD